jgi:carbonic anhydrase
MNLDSLESLPVIRDWVKRSEAVLDRVGGPDQIPQAIAENVKLQLEHLGEYECVKNAVDAGNLKLHGWVYHFESGQIDFLTGDAEVVA